MSKSVYTDILLKGGASVQNLRFPNLSTAPSAPVVGQSYFDTTATAGKLWNGSTWDYLTNFPGSYLSPSIIATNSSNRFVTDTQITNWNSTYSNLGNYLPLSGGNITGNLTVGTTNQSYRFHVIGNTNTVGYVYQNGYLVSFNNANSLFLYDPSANPRVAFNSGALANESKYYATTHSFLDAVGSSYMTINSSGNMGINTTSPTSKLHVVGGITSSSLASQTGKPLIVADATGLIGYGNINTADISTNSNNRFVTDTQISNWNSTYSTIGNYLPLTGGNITGALNVSTKVGIGMTTPTTALDVRSSTIGTALRIGGIAYGTSNDVSFDLYAINATAVIYGRLGLGINNGAVGNESGFLTFSTINSGTLSEKMRISASGYVGINKTAPTQQLDVNGNVNVGTYLYINSQFFAYATSVYNILYDSNVNPRVLIGNSADPSNYYNSTNHYFRTLAGTNMMVLTQSGQTVAINNLSITSEWNYTGLFGIGSARTHYYGCDPSKNFVIGSDNSTVNFNITNFANAYFSGNKMWHQGNQGHLSGMDADTLDGQHGTFYQTITNIAGWNSSIRYVSDTEKSYWNGKADNSTFGSYVQWSSVQLTATNWSTTNGNPASVGLLKSIADGKSDVGHTHAYSSLTGLPYLFNGDYNALSNPPNLGAYVQWSSVQLTATNWSTTNGNPASVGLLKSIADGKSDNGHSHAYSSLTGLPNLSQYYINGNNLSLPILTANTVVSSGYMQMVDIYLITTQQTFVSSGQSAGMEICMIDTINSNIMRKMPATAFKTWINSL